MPEFERKFDVTKFESLGRVPDHLKSLFLLQYELVSELNTLATKRESMIVFGDEHSEYVKIGKQIELIKNECRCVKQLLILSLNQYFPIDEYNSRYVFLPNWHIALVSRDKLPEEL